MTTVDLHIYIDKDNKMLVTPERIRLLWFINSTGSLLKASEEMGISYNKAWKLLDKMNKVANKSVTEKTRGGKGGGGATLTEYGRLMLKEYEAIKSMVNRFKIRLNAEINI